MTITGLPFFCLKMLKNRITPSFIITPDDSKSATIELQILFQKKITNKQERKIKFLKKLVLTMILILKI